MKKIIVSTIVISLLLSAASLTIGEKEPLMLPLSGNTLYVGGSGPGNYSSIQDAIDNASDGDTVYVFSGIYYGRVNVYKSIELIGEDRDTTIIDGVEDSCVVSVVVNGIKISGFTIQNSSDGSSGIVIHLHSDNKIVGNNIADCRYGIYLRYSSSNNEIVGNNITDSYFGITLWDSSSNNIISDNNITNTNYGVSQKYDSDNNTISGNHFTENSCGIYLYDSCDNTSVYENTFVGNSGDCILVALSSNISIADNVLEDNTAVGIIIGHSFDCDVTNNIIINSGGSGIYTSGDVCKRHNISGNTVINSGKRGIELSPGSNIIVTNNLIDTTALDGISLLFDSDNNIISGNIINNTGNHGIWLTESTDNEINGNIITNSTNCGINSNSDDSYILNNVIEDNIDHGIYTDINVKNCTIAGNIIQNNGGNGIFLDFSGSYTQGNTITENFIEHNDENGIELCCVLRNEIFGNTIRYNTNCGLYMWFDSSYNNIYENIIAKNNCGILSANGYFIGNIDNSFYHNNFIDNNLNAYDLYTNAWDDGYPSGGNYWSDYTGNDANGDGIGDTPYPIPDGSNEDRYPLMVPWDGNEPPYTPNIDGPTNGKAGTEYSYTFVSIDPNGDDIANYTIDWDDNGGFEVAEGPFGSGEEITVSHTWYEKGIYTIRAKAKDIYGAESNWGYLEVTMPKNQPSSQQSQSSSSGQSSSQPSSQQSTTTSSSQLLQSVVKTTNR